MVKRSILTICLVVASLMMLAPGAMASYQVQTVGGYGPYQTGLGGEFTLFAKNGLDAVLGSYSTSTMNQYGPSSQPNFQTFCVQENEYIYVNTTYDAQISQSSVFNGHVLTNGAAWLYSEFATGDLKNYGYVYLASGRANLGAGSGNNNALQQALWYYMGQVPNNPANIFIQAADAKFGAADALKASEGRFGVSVLNLWYYDGTTSGKYVGNREKGTSPYGYVNPDGYKYAVQDQLIMVPEPFTLLFLGGCLLGAGMVGRKFTI